MSSPGPPALPLTFIIQDKYRAAGPWRRLLVTASDPSMSETTTLLKADATDLVLRMAEAGTLPPAQVARADLAYHDINRSRGLYYQLQHDGAVERTARDIDILEAKTHPPHSSNRQPG